MASILAGNIIAPAREQLSVHAAEGAEVFLQLHVLVCLASSDYANHVRHDLIERDLEGEWLDRVYHVQIDFRQHLELVPLPEDSTPVWLATERHQMLFFRRR